jgi:D-3-phosphoglycerate dehydrogenase
LTLDDVIVVTDRIAEAGLRLLRASFKDVRLVGSLDEARLAKTVSDAQVIVARLTKISRNVIESAGRLKLIVRHGVGVDNIDVAAATERGVQVVFTPEGFSASVAEFTIAAMLSLLRRMKTADSAARAGNWTARDSELIGTELFGKTVGIVGLGRIGLEVAKRIKPFEVELLYYDLVRHLEAERKIGIDFTPFNTLLTRSDVVSLHVPATSENYHILGRKELALMKPTALLINMARGSVVDEAALVDVLSSGRLAGAALDVFEREPLTKENPLVQLPNVLLSPHMSGHTEEALDRTAVEVAEAVVMVLSGKRARYLANPEVLKHPR